MKNNPWQRTTTKITGALIGAFGVLGGEVASGSDFTLGPLVQVSGPSPLGTCSPTNFPSSEVEPWIVVNPTNPNNIVGVWRQDVDFLFGGFVVGVSFDGGGSWQSVVIPGHIQCADGSFMWGSDPWLTFAPNGDLYFTSTVHDTRPGGQDIRSAALVSKSTDSGLTWGAPITLIENGPRPISDKGSITADPTNAQFVYAIWTDSHSSGRGQAVFARTTNAGLSWEPARVIYDPLGIDVTSGHQIVVLPDGMLADLFTHSVWRNAKGGAPHDDLFLTVLRSADRGATWGTPIRAVQMFPARVFDPDTGRTVNTSASSISALPEVAVDPNNGNLYAVWEDARFTPSQANAIAFSMSTDGGSTWSSPIKINKTPTNILPANQQAFTPSIAVAADGTVGVSYYDFRFNDASPGLPTDYWFVHAHPTAPGGLTNPANWGDELRLTDTSFDMEQAPAVGGFFVGDYEGLASGGNDFLAFFSQPHGSDFASVFFRRVGP